MSNLPLKALKWSSYQYGDGVVYDAITPICEYDLMPQEDGGCIVKYYNRQTEEPTKEATGFATIDDAKTWCWNHYNEKMQPYVKPTSAKVYELAFDCDESYFTVFMTTEKQQAVDFMESVKDADQDFISSYGFDDDADELLIEQYDDNHPLKPYASKIFEPIYEDSFSEWATSYAGNSLVSQLSIIEHELFVKQGE